MEELECSMREDVHGQWVVSEGLTVAMYAVNVRYVLRLPRGFQNAHLVDVKHHRLRIALSHLLVLVL